MPFLLGNDARASRAADCGVLGFAAVAATPDDLTAGRASPPPLPGPGIHRRVLRHAADQTVAGLLAVSAAVTDFGLGEVPFADWGVLAAPRFLGRVPCKGWIDDFARAGALTVSPHFIANASLHGLSGTVSLALGARGPNFGIGGGNGNVPEGLLAALSLLEGTARRDAGPTGRGVPGVWLILTEWDPEEPLRDNARQPGALCHAVALALVPRRTPGGLTLSFFPGATRGPAPFPDTVAGLGRSLSRLRKAGPGFDWSCPVPGATLRLAA
jgi:hypothetical protein